MEMNNNFSRKKKIAIIGAGYVGASIAYALTIRNLAQEIVLIDIDENKAEGEALDIQHGIPVLGSAVVRVGAYEDCKDCDLIIITAGRNRRPGESRLDLIAANSQILKDILIPLQKYYTKGVILLVSNPIDVLVYECTKMMGLPDGRVFGTGCMLDTSRMTCLLADYLKRDTEAVKINIVGEHGDAQIPVWSKASVDGIPIQEYCNMQGLSWTEETRASLATRVRNMGASIIKAKGKTQYGIATVVCSLAEAILCQRVSMASVCTVLQGEYGVKDVALSVPSILGVNGVEKRLEEKWAEQELALFQRAADKMRGVLKIL